MKDGMRLSGLETRSPLGSESPNISSIASICPAHNMPKYFASKQCAAALILFAATLS